MTAKDRDDAKVQFDKVYGIYEKIGVIPSSSQADEALIKQMRSVALSMFCQGLYYAERVTRRRLRKTRTKLKAVSSASKP